MTTKQTEQTLVFDTPNGIAYFRLASIKSQLRLEMAGLKARGGALRPRLAAEFGLKPRDKHAKFIEVIEERMGVLLKAKEAETAAVVQECFANGTGEVFGDCEYCNHTDVELQPVAGLGWCEWCIEDHSVSCESCGSLMPSQDMHGPQGETLCWDCAQPIATEGN